MKNKKRAKAKQRLKQMLGDDVEIKEDSIYDGFYISMLSDYPCVYFHISQNGIAVEVTKERKTLIKRSAACKLLEGILCENN